MVNQQDEFSKMTASRKYSHYRPLGHPRRNPDYKISKPADAAILIVWRKKRGARVEVLMGCRGRRASFLPSFFVFPGGRLDPLDSLVRVASPLDPAFAGSMGVRGNKELAQALAVTAVRETFEETGLLLGNRGDVGDVAEAVWQSWRSRGLAPHLEQLHYFGRAITSPESPQRFNARFFVVHADWLQGQLGGSGELSELAFYDVDDVMVNKPIVDVTEFMLKSLTRFIVEPADFYSAAPIFFYRGLVPFVRYQAISGPLPNRGRP